MLKKSKKISRIFKLSTNKLSNLISTPISFSHCLLEQEKDHLKYISNFTSQKYISVSDIKAKEDFLSLLNRERREFENILLKMICSDFDLNGILTSDNNFDNWTDTQLFNFTFLLLNFVNSEKIPKKDIFLLEILNLLKSRISNEKDKILNHCRLLRRLKNNNFNELNLFNLEMKENAELIQTLIKNKSREEFIELIDINDSEASSSILGLVMEKEMPSELCNFFLDYVEKMIDFESLSWNDVFNYIRVIKGFYSEKINLKLQNFYSNLIIRTYFNLCQKPFDKTVEIEEAMKKLKINPFSIDLIAYSYKLCFSDDLDKQSIRSNLKLLELFCNANQIATNNAFIDKEIKKLFFFLKNQNYDFSDFFNIFTFCIRETTKTNLYFWLNYFLIELEKDNNLFNEANLEVLYSINDLIIEKFRAKDVYLSNIFNEFRNLNYINLKEENQMFHRFNNYFYVFTTMTFPFLGKAESLNRYLRQIIGFIHLLQEEKFESIHIKLLKGILSFLKKKKFDKEYNDIYATISSYIITLNRINFEKQRLAQLFDPLLDYFKFQFTQNLSDEEKFNIFFYISQIFEKYENKLEFFQNEFVRFTNGKFYQKYKWKEETDTKESKKIIYYFGNLPDFDGYEKIIIVAEFFGKLELLLEKTKLLDNLQGSTRLTGIELLKTISILLNYNNTEKLIVNLLKSLFTIFYPKFNFNINICVMKIYFNNENPIISNLNSDLIKKIHQKNIKVTDPYSQICLANITYFNILKKDEEDTNKFTELLYLFEIIGNEQNYHLTDFYLQISSLSFFADFCQDLEIENIIKLPLQLLQEANLKKISKFSPDFKNSENHPFIKNVFLFLKKNNICCDFLDVFLDNLDILIDQEITDALFDFEIDYNEYPKILGYLLKLHQKVSDEKKINFFYNYYIQTEKKITKKEVLFYKEKVNQITIELVVKNDHYKFKNFNPDLKISSSNSFTEKYEIEEAKLNLNKFLIKSNTAISSKNSLCLDFNFRNLFYKENKNLKETLKRYFFWNKFSSILNEMYSLPDSIDAQEKIKLLNVSQNTEFNRFMKIFLKFIEFKQFDLIMFPLLMKTPFIIYTDKEIFHIIKDNVVFQKRGNFLRHMEILTENSISPEYIHFNNIEQINISKKRKHSNTELEIEDENEEQEFELDYKE